MKQLLNNAVLLHLHITVALVTYLNMHVNVANDFTQLGNNLPSLHPASDDLHCDHNDALKNIRRASPGTTIIEEDFYSTAMHVVVTDCKSGQKQNRER